MKASLRWMNQSKLPSKYQKGQVVMMLLRITRWVVKFSDSKPREYVVLSQSHALHWCQMNVSDQSWLFLFCFFRYLFYKGHSEITFRNPLWESLRRQSNGTFFFRAQNLRRFPTSAWPHGLGWEQAGLSDWLWLKRSSAMSVDMEESLTNFPIVWNILYIYIYTHTHGYSHISTVFFQISSHEP